MVNTKIRLIIVFAAKDGEALYSQQKQYRKQTLGGHKQKLVYTRTQEKGADPTRDWPRLACVCPGACGTREDSTHGYHQMVNTKIRLIIFFAAKDGEDLYSQQKQDQELTVAQTMRSEERRVGKEC